MTYGSLILFYSDLYILLINIHIICYWDWATRLWLGRALTSIPRLSTDGQHTPQHDLRLQGLYLGAQPYQAAHSHLWLVQEPHLIILTSLLSLSK